MHIPTSKASSLLLSPVTSPVKTALSATRAVRSPSKRWRFVVRPATRTWGVKLEKKKKGNLWNKKKYQNQHCWLATHKGGELHTRGVSYTQGGVRLLEMVIGEQQLGVLCIQIWIPKEAPISPPARAGSSSRTPASARPRRPSEPPRLDLSWRLRETREGRPQPGGGGK